MHRNLAKNPFVQRDVLFKTKGLDILPAFNIKGSDPADMLYQMSRNPSLKGVMDQVAAASGLPQASSLMSMPFGTPNAMPNAALPFWQLMTRDPLLVETITAPLMVEEAYGQKIVGGTLNDSYLQFGSREYNGSGSAMNDFSNDGSAGVTYNQFFRASYAHQTHVIFGITESEKWASAGYDWVSDNHRAAIDYLKRVMNYIGFYGVKGLKLWGGLTDPNLPAPISPTAAAAGGVSWDNKLGEEVYDDILLCISHLIDQTKNAIRFDNRAKIRVLVPPRKLAALNKRMSYIQAPLMGFLKDMYPNMEFIGVPEMETDVGDMLQMFIPEYLGRPTIQYSPSVPLREFPMFQHGSRVDQKKAAGTFGCVTFYGLLCVSMLGI